MLGVIRFIYMYMFLNILKKTSFDNQIIDEKYKYIYINIHIDIYINTYSI